MKDNRSNTEYSLLRNEDDEKKIETRITIDFFADLRRLNMLLSDPEFKDIKWTGNFPPARQLVNHIISFLSGESIIQFGFSCRVMFNLSSQYLKSDLKKLKTYQFAKPLFDSDEILQLAESRREEITLATEKLETRSNYFDCCLNIPLCLLWTSGFGFVSTVVALGIEQGISMNRTNTVTALAVFGSVGFCSLVSVCAGLCIRDGCVVPLVDRSKRQLNAQYNSLYNLGLITNLRKWQNKDNPVNDSRKLLPDRSYAP